MALREKTKFSEKAMKRLERNIRISAENSDPQEYEIKVDGMRSVGRTDNPDLFNTYLDYMDEDTEQVEVMLYKGSSNNCEKFLYVCEKEPEKQAAVGLSGLEIDSRIRDGIAKEKQQWEKEKLEARTKELEDEVKELEESNEKLQNTILELKGKDSPLKPMFGEFGSLMVESFLRRNPNLIKNIPGGTALAGYIEEDNKRLAQESREEKPETEVSFKAKEDSPDEEINKAVGFQKYLHTLFTPVQYHQIMDLIDLLGKNKEKIEEFINQLNAGKEEESNAVQL